MIEGGSSAGPMGMEVNAPVGVMSRGAEAGSMAAGGVLAQATAVAEQAMSASMVSSPLDGVQAAMHSAAREAWLATESRSIAEPSVQVFSPEVSAMLAFTGWQAQNSLVEQPQNLVSTETVSTNMTADEVARAAWDKSEPDSVLTEANKVVEDAVNKSAVHVMSPFEVMGLLSVGANAQQALSKEASIDHVAPVIEVAAPVELPFTEPLPATSPVELLASSPEVEHAIEMAIQEVSPVTGILSKSSDEAIASKVISLAEELGVELNLDTQSAVVEALGNANRTFIGTSAVSEVTAVDPMVEVGVITKLAQAAEVEIDPTTGEEVLPVTQQALEPQLAQKNAVDDKPKVDDVGFEPDEVANDERRKVAEQVFNEAIRKEGEEPDEILAQRVVEGFFAGVEGNTKAISEIAQGQRDGTLDVYIHGQVTGISLGTPSEAKREINRAIGDHPAVRRGSSILSEEDARKVSARMGIRRQVIVSSLAA